MVRRYLPEVAVPELPEDVAGYIKEISKHRYFEPITLSREDLERTQMYAAKAQREARQASVDNIDDYLRSLNMGAVVQPLEDVNFERFGQLINKSNQFNLTTKRYTPADLQQMRSDPLWVTRGFRLTDTFGDNGLICIVLCKLGEEVLDIDTWLMSCRVLNRGVEHFVISHIYDLARGAGLKYIEGEYRPTGKNGMVKHHYQCLGFEQVGNPEDSITRWRLPVGDGTVKWEHYIVEAAT